jgi:hypothetical protein
MTLIVDQFSNPGLWGRVGGMLGTIGFLGVTYWVVETPELYTTFVAMMMAEIFFAFITKAVGTTYNK